MPLVSMKPLLSSARIGTYGIGAFNVANMEMIIGVIMAAEDCRSPVILQIAEKRLSSSPLHIIGPAMRSAAEHANVPVALHFDHGVTEERIREAIDLGFTSVMFDGSSLSLKENINATARLCGLAHQHGLPMEGEIGSIGGAEADDVDLAASCARPEDALRLIQETGVDALAVAIGNAHGLYHAVPKLRFDILKSVSSKCSIPLVLHGGTGLSDVDYRTCIQLGMCKINIGTAAFNAAASAAFPHEKGIFGISKRMAEAVFKETKRHIRLFGSLGIADR